MALNIITNNYNGEASREFYSQIIHQSGTISGNHISIIPDIKDKLALRKLDLGSVLQSDGCYFNASGDFNMDERLLDPVSLKINLEMCISDLERTWVAQQMEAGANAGMPADFTSVINALVSKRIGSEIEDLIWSGDTAAGSNNLHDGFLKIMAADANTLKVTAPIVITSANVLAELERGLELVPDGVYDSENLRLYVSMPVWRAYRSALGTEASNYQWDIQRGFTEVYYKGIQVLPAKGMGSASRYVFAERNNLAFGTDLVSDLDNVRLLDMRTTNGDETVRMAGRMKSGVQYAVSQEIVLY